MTRSELNTLKEKALSRKNEARDLEKLVAYLYPLLENLSKFLPEEVRELINAYKNK